MKFINTKKKTLIPNILLTNHCNQHCPFCFAQKEMKTSETKDMSVQDFKWLVKLLKKNGVNDLRLMGGEPTIHPQFPEVLEIGIKHFRRVLIFSNGLIPEKSHRSIQKNLEKLEFNFNIATPIFTNQEKRQDIIKKISNLSARSKSSVAFTVFDMGQDYAQLLSVFEPKTLANLGVAFSFAKSLYGSKPAFTQDQYLDLGEKIVKTTRDIYDLGVRDIYIECGLKKSMFNQKQINYLQERTVIRGWGCSGKWSSFDITADLSVIPCFPFYKEIRFQLKADSDLYKLKNKINRIRADKGTCLA